MTNVRVWPRNGTQTRRYENATFTVHDDGDLSIGRDGSLIAVWSRGQWQHVEAED